MPSVALVVEGEFDIYAYSALIYRENGYGVSIHPRPCRNSVSGRFAKILNPFRYQNPIIQRAVVVSDAHGTDRALRLADLQTQARNVEFPFPVEYVVAVQELEAMLLCDPRAIESVCAERGRPIVLSDPVESPELFDDPKTELVRQLSQGGVQYTKIVAKEIAERVNLDRLTYWSRSYRDFRAAVRL